MLQKVYENVLTYFQVCIENDGHHLLNVILKKNLYRTKCHNFRFFGVLFHIVRLLFFSYNYLKM